MSEQIRYWLCCGSRDPQHSDCRARRCIEAELGYPEHCRFGTKREHSSWQLDEPPATIAPTTKDTGGEG